MRLARAYPVLALTGLALAGCGAASPAAPVSAGTRAPVGFSMPPPASEGGEAVLGRSADAVSSLLGKPRLDVNEGPARKLQFAGSTCILDVYFYAPQQGGTRVATHIDARSTDGRDAGTDGCITALKQR